jgi:pentatricopeptide repeat protein
VLCRRSWLVTALPCTFRPPVFSVRQLAAAPQGHVSASEAVPGAMLLQGAVWVLKRMSDAGCGPDIDSFNTLMSAAVADDDPEAALGLWQRLCADTDLRPDTRTYTILIQV